MKKKFRRKSSYRTSRPGAGKRFYLLFVAVLGLIACSSSNSEAPRTGQTHPPKYVLIHGAEAQADLESCQLCHGLDFKGTDNPVPSCFSCHSSGPPFVIHPVPYTDPADHGPAARRSQAACRKCHGTAPNLFDGGLVADPELFNRPAGTCSSTACHPAAMAHPTNWQGSNEDIDLSYHSSHRNISQQTVEESCALCHKTDGPGIGLLAGAPSCFSTAFTNADGTTTSCHGGGFNVSPHVIPFLEPPLHGPEAKDDLGTCQECHGQPQTILFDGGIAKTSCSTAQCHPAAGAHPTRWQGENDATPDYLSSHRTANRLETSCAICHNVSSDAPGPHPQAPSCFTANFTNSDGITTGCHAGGPGAPHGIPYTSATLHGPAAKTDLLYCQGCHGTPGTIQFNGGDAPTACSTALCHPAAGAHPTRWQGSNDVTPEYLSSHRDAGNQNAACSTCHEFTEGRAAPDPSAPSCFSASFTNADGITTGCHAGGPVAPHAIPYTDPEDHGPEAKADLTSCQPCHATPSDGGPGSNPRFNVQIGSLSTGCEDCHATETAHPYPYWMGAAPNSHKTAGNLADACSLCHGANLLGVAEGGVGPACQSCHQAGSPLTDLNCTSCHNDPPDSGVPAGDIRPNRDGSHSEHNSLAKVVGQCLPCHNGAGTNTFIHYDTAEPASVALLESYRAETGSFVYDQAASSCSGVSCHGGQTTVNWYTGTIDVNSDCLTCHQYGTAQYNSYQSGPERHHENEAQCTFCHDPAKLAAGHFSGLDTPTFEQAADQTLQDVLSYDPATNQGCNVPGCHGSVRTWN